MPIPQRDKIELPYLNLLFLLLFRSFDLDLIISTDNLINYTLFAIVRERDSIDHQIISHNLRKIAILQLR